ncbi:MAG: hypothetical protein ACO263_02630 [Cyclobacteriaceae bacterium]
MVQLKDSVEGILSQLEDLVIQFDDRQFKACSPAMNGASVGQHVRHVIEFFTSLEKGYRCGTVNYDQRAHDSLIESDPTVACAELQKIRRFFYENPQDRLLTLQTAYHEQESEWIPVSTTFHRELAYTIDHAIHHMAMIKAGIADVASQVLLTENFGVAYSTRRHRQKLSVSV